MCGIIGYTGNKRALPFVLGGLMELEYRGYDSVGIALADGLRVRVEGGPSDLEPRIPRTLKKSSASMGIGHTRWATHGPPAVRNAHPHTDSSKSIYVVHNGIIENNGVLKDELAARGVRFNSDTDSEVLAHMIAFAVEEHGFLEQAVAAVLPIIKGTYGIAVISTKEPEKIVAARLGSPIVIGITDEARFVASDAGAFAGHARVQVDLQDGDIAILTPKEHHIMRVGGGSVTRLEEEIPDEIADAGKGDHAHFMLKEIFEIPQTLPRTWQGRVNPEKGRVKLGGFDDLKVSEWLPEINRVVIVACGTSYFAGLLGVSYLEELAGIPTEAVIASEFMHRPIPLGKDVCVIAISQSGETLETLQALRKAKEKGALTFGIVNKVGTAIAKETHAGMYLHAGPEIAVASTKAFFAQAAGLLMVAVALGNRRSLASSRAHEVLSALVKIPEGLNAVLTYASHTKQLAELCAAHQSMFFVGRGANLPSALEGALKMKEITYIHAEGVPAGELMHGTLALIDENMPTVAVVPRGSVRTKTLVSIEKIRSRGGSIIGIITKGDEEAAELCDEVIEVPDTPELLAPLVTTLALHLLAYYTALELDRNPDKPRNLAKAVTVE